MGLKRARCRALTWKPTDCRRACPTPGWSDFASAQLSFPFIMALGLRFGRIDLSHFKDDVRRDESIASICKRVHVSVSPELDKTYPDKRPARVTLRTANGNFTREVDEALGSSTLPLDDTGLEKKFIDLVSPVLGSVAAHRLSERALVDRYIWRRNIAHRGYGPAT